VTGIMSNKNLIEKLKNKDCVRPFGLMSEEEQECFKKVGKENCIYYSEHECWSSVSVNQIFQSCITYAIKPDYKPEPEYVDLEIYINDGIDKRYRLGCSVNNMWRDLHELPSLPNFEGFYMPDPVVKDGYEYLFIGTVARNISKGKKVFARFRK
jgi:hypothetical protein